VPVDQQQDAGVIVAGQREPAHRDVGVVAIVAREESADAVQDFGQRAVAEPLDLFLGDDADRRGGFSGILLVLGGGGDPGHLLKQGCLSENVRGSVGLLTERRYGRNPRPCKQEQRRADQLPSSIGGATLAHDSSHNAAPPCPEGKATTESERS
jgi:hypothetical protein